jgi:hypothetical protein
VKLRFLKINLGLGGGRSKSSRGPPVGHRWSRQRGILDISQSYRPLVPVTGIASSFTFYLLNDAKFNIALSKQNSWRILELHISGLFPSFYYSKIFLTKLLSIHNVSEAGSASVQGSRLARSMGPHRVGC